MRTIALDFETFYRAGYGIKENGLYGYTHHEEFDPYMISVCDGEDTWVGHPKDFNWDALAGAQIVSHNAAFDRTVYEAMVEQNMAPAVPYAAWDCSANLSAYLCNRRSLADAVEYLLRVKVDKTMRNWMKGKTWADAVAKGKADELTKYAELDAQHCFALWDKFHAHWPSAEVLLSRLTIDQSTRGIMVDRDYVKWGLAKLQESMLSIEESLPWVADGEKPTGVKIINLKCVESGIPCPPVKSHEGGEEAYEAWESLYAPKYPWIQAVANYRSVNKVLGAFERMLAWLRPDNTMPFGLKYFGAHTGRFSGDAGLNMQNLRKVPLMLDPETMLPIDSTFEGPAVVEVCMRRPFIPRPGKKMISCDLGQIEPRVLAWRSGNAEQLAKLAKGLAIYDIHARQSLGWTGPNLKDAAENDSGAQLLYKRAKAEVLALGYGCGPDRYVEAAMAMAGYRVELEDAVKEVAQFRKNNPLVVDLWREMDEALTSACNRKEDLILELPSGRELTYPHCQYESRRFRDKKTGKTVTKQIRSANVAGIRKSLYGGLLTENWVQAASRDIFAYHLIEMSDIPAITPLFSVHDEAVIEVAEDFPKEEIVRIMSSTPEFIPGCPLSADAKVLDYYRK